MRIALILIFILQYMGLNAQFKGYYLSNGYRDHRNPDLVHVRIDNKGCHALDGWTFSDSVYQVKLDSTHMRSSVLPLGTVSQKDTGLERFYLDSPSSFYHKDSIYLNNRWFFISFQYYTDNFIGGRPPQQDYRIHVESLGMIYSSSNFLPSHNYILLITNDSFKNELLRKGFDLVSKGGINLTAESKGVWERMITCHNSLSYERTPFQLKSEWMKRRKDLALVAFTADTVDNKNKYTVTILNNSDSSYYIPDYMQIAPVKAVIHFSRSKTEWDLLDTHYGQHFFSLRKKYFLKPGQQLTLSYTFHLQKREAMDYSGLQFYYAVPNLRSWIVQKPLRQNGQNYYLFPFREVLTLD